MADQPSRGSAPAGGAQGERAHRGAAAAAPAIVRRRAIGLTIRKGGHATPARALRESCRMNACAFVVGPATGPGAAVAALARRLEFAAVQAYTGIEAAARQARR